MKMKNSKRQNQVRVAALCGGVAALLSLAPGAPAQSVGDALINKLEQKGILSSEEAKELREAAPAGFWQQFHEQFRQGVRQQDRNAGLGDGLQVIRRLPRAV